MPKTIDAMTPYDFFMTLARRYRRTARTAHNLSRFATRREAPELAARWSQRKRLAILDARTALLDARKIRLAERAMRERRARNEERRRAMIMAQRPNAPIYCW